MAEMGIFRTTIGIESASSVVLFERSRMLWSTRAASIPGFRAVCWNLSGFSPNGGKALWWPTAGILNATSAMQSYMQAESRLRILSSSPSRTISCYWESDRSRG